MTQEEKELLFIDLSARWTYGVKVTWDGKHPLRVTPHIYCTIVSENNTNNLPKLLLRPMSSMTEEEKEELKSKCIHTETEEDWEGVRSDVWGIQILDKYDTRRWDNPIWPSTINMDAIDWLNAHHFDYRGLIEKGLALEAPEGMYD